MAAVATALPQMLETSSDVNVRPTKLFIGGISRRTTTKQLRDHFSVCGRVLDCVAMRQPDGRPRGFGYVTLDSPEAAEFYLRSPQMIDDRIVDLKPAVPDASMGVAKGGAFLSGQAGMMSPHGYKEWPVDMNMSMSAYYPGAESAWPWMDHQALSCMGVLSHQHQSLPVLPAQFPPAALPPLGPVPPLAPAKEYPTQENPGSPKAPDCISLLTRAQEQLPAAGVAKATWAKAVLGEVTNIMADRESGKDAVKQPDYLSGTAGKESGKVNALALKSFQPKHVVAPPPLSEEFFVMPDDDEALPSATSTYNPMSARRGSSSSLSEGSSPRMGPATPMSDGPLPSAGSAQHFIGECRRCNFFAKGRCKNGQDCTFCHFTHDRRKLTRQEKREAQAARALTQQDSSPEAAPAPPNSPWAPEEQEAACKPPPGDFRTPSALRLPPGLFLLEDDSSTPLCVPTPMGSAISQVTLPPGLCPPGLLSPSGASLLSTTPCATTTPVGGMLAMPRATLASAPSALLSTRPPCSAPPRATVAAKETATIATQTDEDHMCPECGGKA